MKKMILLLAVMTLVAATVQAAAYQEVTSWNAIENGIGATSHYMSASDGSATYHHLALNDSPAITKVDSSGNVTTLVSPLQWAVATGGKTAMTAFNSFDVHGSNLLFADSHTDGIWAVDKNSGSITSWASSSAISGYTGFASAQLLTPGDAYSGKMYFYEGKSDSILSVGSNGVISTYLSDTQLTSVAGNDRVSGGMAFTSGGDLIWGSTTSDSLYMWDSAGVGSTLLSKGDITALTGKAAAGFGDIYYASNDLVYFYESTSDSILSFDPTNAINTLKYELTEAQLLAGPAAYDNVFGLTEYEGELAFNTMGARGFYAVPEPATMLLLGFGGFALRMKRKRA